MVQKKFSAVLVIVLFFGCKKKEDEFVYFNASSKVSSFFENNFQELKQEFVINPTKFNLIEGKGGVVIGIPSNSFAFNNGDYVKGEIKIELVEILDYRLMIKSNKTSTSNGEILVSGGQAFIKAYQNNEELKLIKTIVIRMPFEEYDENMKLFFGDEFGGDLNWEETEDSLNIVDISLLSPRTFMDELLIQDTGLMVLSLKEHIMNLILIEKI